MIFSEGVTQLGDILRHLHSQNNLSSGGSPVQDVQLGRARHIQAQPVSSDVHPSGHLVDQIFTAKANVTHVASLQMNKVSNILMILQLKGKKICKIEEW